MGLFKPKGRTVRIDESLVPLMERLRQALVHAEIDGGHCRRFGLSGGKRSDKKEGAAPVRKSATPKEALKMHQQSITPKLVRPPKAPFRRVRRPYKYEWSQKHDEQAKAKESIESE